MAKTAQITLDGTTYTVPAPNIGQLEEITEIFEGPRSKIPFGVLRITMKRADPKIDFDVASPSIDEVATAVQVILKLAGLEKADANPPQPQLTVVASG